MVKVRGIMHTQMLLASAAPHNVTAAHCVMQAMCELAGWAPSSHAASLGPGALHVCSGALFAQLMFKPKQRGKTTSISRKVVWGISSARLLVFICVLLAVQLTIP